MSAQTRYQRRHYRELATMIGSLRGIAITSGNLYILDAADVIRDQMADVFERDNPRFVRSRFVDACAGNVAGQTHS